VYHVRSLDLITAAFLLIVTGIRCYSFTGGYGFGSGFFGFDFNLRFKYSGSVLDAA